MLKSHLHSDQITEDHCSAKQSKPSVSDVMISIQEQKNWSGAAAVPEVSHENGSLIACLPETALFWQTHLRPCSGLDWELCVLDQRGEGGGTENGYKWKKWEDAFKELNQTELHQCWPNFQVNRCVFMCISIILWEKGQKHQKVRLTCVQTLWMWLYGIYTAAGTSMSLFTQTQHPDRS